MNEFGQRHGVVMQVRFRPQLRLPSSHSNSQQTEPLWVLRTSHFIHLSSCKQGVNCTHCRYVLDVVIALVSRLSHPVLRWPSTAALCVEDSATEDSVVVQAATPMARGLPALVKHGAHPLTTSLADKYNKVRPECFVLLLILLPLLFILLRSCS